MAKQTFKFVTAEGKTATRKSERTYTHVIVGRSNLAAERDGVLSWGVEQQAENYEFAVLLANTPVGEIPKGCTWKNSEDDSRKYKATIEKFPTKDLYVSDYVERRMASINERGLGDRGNEIVLQWSMSANNANKGVSSWAKNYLDVKVVAL